jgi:hypothetical protein
MGLKVEVNGCSSDEPIVKLCAAGSVGRSWTDFMACRVIVTCIA